MNTYLAIITTVLVVTQIIRVVQNAIQLRRQYASIKQKIDQLPDVTEEDNDLQKKAYQLIVEYLGHRVQFKEITYDET